MKKAVFTLNGVEYTKHEYNVKSFYYRDTKKWKHGSPIKISEEEYEEAKAMYISEGGHGNEAV